MGGGAGMYGPGSYGGSPGGGYGYMDPGAGGHPPYAVSFLWWKPLAGNPRRQTEDLLLVTRINISIKTLILYAFAQRRTLLQLTTHTSKYPPATSSWRELYTNSLFIFILSCLYELPL